MTKYIIEYLGGTRGDFLCNFLNHGQVFLKENNTSRTMGASLKHLSMWSYYAKKSPDKTVLERHLKECKDKFMPSHSLHFLDNECKQLIQQMDYKICKIIFSKKYYHTILIEEFFKNISLTPELTKYLNFHQLPRTPENENKAIVNFLSECKNTRKENNFFYNFFNNANNDNKILLDYEKLYLDIPDYDIFAESDLEQYKKLVPLTILPEIVELYGKKYYPREYGYLCY